MMTDPNILEKASIAMAAQARAALEARINFIPQENLNSVNSGVQEESSGLQKNIQEMQKLENSKTKTNNPANNQTNKNQVKTNEKTNSQSNGQNNGQVIIPDTKEDNDGGSVINDVIN
jgi:hypothetical protein